MTDMNPSVYQAPRTPSPLRVYRVSRGLGQAELAHLAGVCPETVCRAERGHTHPRWETMAVLSRVLGVDAAALFPGALSK